MRLGWRKDKEDHGGGSKDVGGDITAIDKEDDMKVRIFLYCHVVTGSVTAGLFILLMVLSPALRPVPNLAPYP